MSCEISNSEKWKISVFSGFIHAGVILALFPIIELIREKFFPDAKPLPLVVKALISAMFFVIAVRLTMK